MKKATISFDAEKWDIYIVADFILAVALVVISMVSADVPRKRIEIVHKSTPYVGSGWMPSNQLLNAPLKTPPAHADFYGLSQEPKVVTTDEQPIIRKSSIERLTSQHGKTEHSKSERLQKGQQRQVSFLVMLAQQQQRQIVYAVRRGAPLLPVLAPIERVKLEERLRVLQERV